jgi:hypothetical protein
MTVEPCEVDYTPQPKQLLLHKSPANEILYGGAAGPGKSHALRMEGLVWALRIPRLQVYLFRRIGPELERNHIIPSQMQFPAGVGVFKRQAKRWEFANGSMLHFCHCQYEDDVFGYQGAEINLLLIDELTSFTEFQYDYLRGRVRTTLDVSEAYQHKIPGIISASNPGGPGHQFVKTRWVEFAAAYECKRAPRQEGGMLRQFIPGLLEDNQILMERDPEYEHRLDALPEPYRTAYREGNWDIFLGQMFEFGRKTHVVEPMPIPDDAVVMCTFDWGFGKPYSVGWWWVDGDGRLYRFSELYGCIRGMPDTGVRQPDPEIAVSIRVQEEELGLTGRRILRLCDPTCFNKKPDYKGGGQGPSTAEVFAEHGLVFSRGDPSRILKIRQVHQRLRVPRDPDGTQLDMPMLQVYSCCRDFIRTIPTLMADVHHAEDVDTTMEDHCYDEMALACMARPLSTGLISGQMTQAGQDWGM